jgi:hypothetical protein
MPHRKNIFGRAEVSEELTVRSAHFSLNNSIVTIINLTSHLDKGPGPAYKITKAFHDEGLLIAENRASGRRGRPIQWYSATEELGNRAAEYNDLQTEVAAAVLKLSVPEVEERSLDAFAITRGMPILGEADRLQGLAEQTNLHRETVRHLSISAFTLANGYIQRAGTGLPSRW